MKKEETKEYFFEYNMNFMMTVATVVTIVAIVVPYFTMGSWFDKKILIDADKWTGIGLLITYVAIFGWMILHEILHGTFYILGGAKRKNITYGAALEKGIFYCRCGEYVNKKAIMCSLMAPFTIIGVITMIIGYITKQWWLVMLSGINIGGAGADLCMFFFFLGRDKDVKFMEYGDSSFFSLKTKEDLSKKKFKCVKAIDKSKVPSNNNKHRLVISKGSWIMLLILAALMLVLLFIN